MKIRYTLWTLTLALGITTATAEIGDRYEDSVRKHGHPVAKLIRQDQTVYLFENNGDTAREVYNPAGECISSDFISMQPVEKNPVAPEPEEAVAPAPEPIPEEAAAAPASESVPEEAATPALLTASIQETAPKKSFPTWMIALPLAIAFGATAGLLIIHRKASIKACDTNKLSLLDKVKTEDDSENKTTSSSHCHREASARLTRNELSFYKTLHEVAQESYLISFHISLDRIVDPLDPGFEAHMPAYKGLKPIFVDFALHDPFDASISAVILLCEQHTTNEYKINRLKFLHEVLGESNIPVFEINENYKYDAEKIQEIIFKSQKQKLQKVA